MSENKKAQKHRLLSGRISRTVILFVIAVLVFVSVLSGIVSGWIPYSAALIKCGKKPIITSSFLESRTYLRPGDSGYGPRLFTDHYLCSEQEAVNLGYTGPAGSLSNRQYLQRQAVADEAAVFAPNKISFVAYTPNYLPTGYTKGTPQIEDIHGKQVLQYLMIDNKSTILIRQG